MITVLRSGYRPDRVTRTGVIAPYDIRQNDPVEVARATINPFIEGIRAIGSMFTKQQSNASAVTAASTSTGQPVAGAFGSVSYPTASQPGMEYSPLPGMPGLPSYSLPSFAHQVRASAGLAPYNPYNRGPYGQRRSTTGPAPVSFSAVPYPRGANIPMANVDYPSTSVPSAGPGVTMTFSGAGFGRPRRGFLARLFGAR